ncbi:hypothetical protein TNCV_77151 [Trichonephila clavipes]|nr:hypothetical protein TNCV_77151 [Trichonephila clavipes]
MSLGNGTRSVPPSHIEIVDVSLCGWACLRESVLIGGSNVASRRGYEIEDFLQYGFGGNVQMLSKRPCCGWSMTLRDRTSLFSTQLLEGFLATDLWPGVSGGQGIESWLACLGSSPVPQKTRRMGQRCTLNLSRAEMSLSLSVVVRRGGANSGVALVI